MCTDPGAPPGSEPYRVAVVGAGPAGAACAIALGRAGVDGVALLDAGPRRGARAVGESVPPDVRLLLDRLGLEAAFRAEGHEPCLGSSSAWGSDVLGHNDFVLNPQGAGWHLDRDRFDAFLRRHAAASGADVVAAGRLAGVTRDDRDHHCLRLADGGVVTTRFVVDATGRASAFARAVGARQVSLDRLTFVYGWFDTAATGRPRSRLTLLEAEEHGWWYAAELPGARLAVAFATDADIATALGRTAEGPWLAAARRTRHLSGRLAGARLTGRVTPVAARSFLLDPVAGPGWVAAGDAAASYDPLAAQGIHKALADGIAAADVVVAVLAGHGDAGDAYARRVRAGFDEYLANRNHFYALERRWPDSPFWQRRQARSRLVAV